jgi:hypothetical protein
LQRNLSARAAQFTAADVFSRAAAQVLSVDMLFFTMTGDVHTARRSWTASRATCVRDVDVYSCKKDSIDVERESRHRH